ncbi:kinase domain protein [Mycobacterium xenopi 3993]|nr:kinase domain protein [Mycobacterium xenopi 3993]
MTTTNLTVGNVSYAAPEQLMDRLVDGRADQYALACTAFHLLTGSPPFVHGNPAVVISKHLSESPPLPGDVRPQLAPFDGPISRALAKEPGDRFPRCRDFANAVKAAHSKPVLSRSEPPAAPVILKPTPWPPTHGAWPSCQMLGKGDRTTCISSGGSGRRPWSPAQRRDRRCRDVSGARDLECDH